jgi:hypothetical protein
VHFLHHLLSADDGLAGKVTTLLGEDLIFNLNCRRSGPLEKSHRAIRVDGVSETSVAIDNQRNLERFGDTRHVVTKLNSGDQADVGHAQHGVGQARPREVHGGKAFGLNQARAERVVGTGQRQRLMRRLSLRQTSPERNHVVAFSHSETSEY